MKKSFENSKKEQCFGQGDCGCIPCCPPCPPQCPQSCCPIVYKTIIQAGEPTPTPTIPSAYAYVYNDGRQTVAASAPILFSSNGVLSDGMTHPVNGNAVTIENAGTYAVWFTMMGTADAQFALFLNDTSVAGTIFGTSPGAAGSAVRSITGGFAIVEAPANSTLALVNFTGAPVTLATGVGGAGPYVNASMMVIRIA